MKIGLKFRPAHSHSAAGSAASNMFCGVGIADEAIVGIESVSCRSEVALTIVQCWVISNT